MKTLELLKTRRSILARNMAGPGPSAGQLAEIFEIATRVSDHGKLAPWRFLVFEGAASVRFGEILKTTLKQKMPEVDDTRLELERTRFSRVPLVLAVISTARPHVKIPEWEQILSAGAVCQNILIAATAQGFAVQWVTEWCAYDDDIAKVLGLETHEKIAGFIYLGTSPHKPDDRPRPDVSELVTRWQEPASGNRL